MRVNFTTYNIQEDQDIIHIPFDKRDILVYNPQEPGPYPWAFARVLGIYHATVSTRTHSEPQTYYFLWVRWFTRDQSLPSFATTRCFDRVAFVPHDSGATVLMTLVKLLGSFARAWVELTPTKGKTLNTVFPGLGRGFTPC